MPALRYGTIIMMTVLTTLAAAPARAQDAKGVEVTPFVAIGSNGASPIGAAMTFPVTSTLSVETEVGYRRGEGRLHAVSMHASLLYYLPRVGRTIPYVIGGVGLAEYGAPIVRPATGELIGTQGRVTLALNAGGGLKIPVRDTWGMRTDARWFKLVGRHGSEHFRVAHGISFDVGRKN